MDSFDTYIARRLPLVSLISTVFIIYPKYRLYPLGVEICGGDWRYRSSFLLFVSLPFLLGINQLADTL